MAERRQSDDAEEHERQRPTPRVADLDAVADGLRAWLAKRFPDREGVELGEMSMPEGAGMSNATLLFEMRWRDAAGERSEGLVVRLKPPAGEKTIFPESDYDMGLQYRAMERLQGKVKVPELIGLELDEQVIGAPFYVMRRLRGVAPPDMPPMHMEGWVRDLPPERQERLWWNGVDEMCRFHKIAADQLDLAFLDFPERGDTLLERLLKRWSDYCDWALGDITHPELDEARQWLYEHQPAQRQSGMCWGDARMANVLFDPSSHEVMALLDWEMCALGDPVLDLSWWVFLDHALASFLPSRLPGIPGERETVEYWRRATGLATDDVHYYKVLAAFAFGAILSRSMLCQPEPMDPLANNFVLPLARELIAQTKG